MFRNDASYDLPRRKGLSLSDRSGEELQTSATHTQLSQVLPAISAPADAGGGGRRICLHSARSITLPWTWRDGLARRETEREARQKAEGGRRPSHAAYHQDWRKGDLSKESILNRGVCTALTRRQSLHLQTCISFLLALAPRPCPQPRSLPPPSQSASAEQSRSVGRPVMSV